MLVFYVGCDEVIVCFPETEQQTIKEYFTDGGRDLENYDREEQCDSVSFNSRITVN